MTQPAQTAIGGTDLVAENLELMAEVTQLISDNYKLTSRNSQLEWRSNDGSFTILYPFTADAGDELKLVVEGRTGDLVVVRAVDLTLRKPN